MKRPSISQLASGTASAWPASLLAGHGTTGLVVAGVIITVATLAGALVPEVFALVMALKAARHQQWMAATATGATRHQVLTNTVGNPFVEIARIRAGMKETTGSRPTPQTPKKAITKAKNGNKRAKDAAC